MKKIALYILSITLCFTACRKDESVFDQSPDERINKTLSDYQAALVSSPTGWKATIIPGNGGIYHFYFRFNSENRVVMYSDFDTATAKHQKESSYRLKALQQPTLIFDTYSYLHLLADPDAAVNGGSYGSGLLSDFEFALDTLYADSIILTGKMNNTRVRLEKASQQELDEWQNGEWADALSFINIANIKNYFKRLTLDGVEYEVHIDPASRTIVFQWLSGGAIKQFATAYYFKAGGIQFENPLTNGSQTITGFSDISWSDDTQTLSVNVNNTAGAIAGAVKPLKTDVNAPRRWWQKAADDDGYWVSLQGFHVNGVDDAYGVTSIPDYAFMIFWPKYGTNSGITYDLTGFITADAEELALNFGAAYQTPAFTSDGRIMFTYLGTLGDVPPEAEDAYLATAGNFLNPAGFYLVQTSETSYDMVSADDAKTWITWVY
ncbi:DUF4302 domain-containing protein [Agriterribacter sp.]|uniref:DUF4302 domain-containing protein n=1 Tax=Agriterribacter sp. TaxID=2821509 RepID=UPI002CAF4401|nr:DUF4302 domain-containing protein [Agriterribacter sp.]HRP55379.1 DUF4302 domain-containing protein [Agriterribacter sp.]